MRSRSPSSASTNDGLNLAVNLLLLFLVVIWLALVYWTYADARRRIEDPMLVGCATAASLFPFIGTIVYMIVRPPEYLEDVARARARDRGRRGAAAQLEQLACPLLRLRGREDLPALPELPAPAQGAVRHLRQAARPALEDLPLLRGRGAGASRPQEPPPPRTAALGADGPRPAAATAPTPQTPPPAPARPAAPSTPPRRRAGASTRRARRSG